LKKKRGKKESRKDNLKLSGFDYFVNENFLKLAEMITLKGINAVNGAKKNFWLDRSGRRVEKGITSALPRVSDGFLFRPGKEDHPLLGAAAGPTPGSWHKGPTWSAYFRDTTLGGAVPLWSMVGVKPGPEMQACRVDEAHLAPRFL